MTKKQTYAERLELYRIGKNEIELTAKTAEEYERRIKELAKKLKI